VYFDSAFGGEDSDSDMDMGDDYMHTCTQSLSFSLSFSCSPSFSLTHSLSLVISLFFFVSLSVFLFHTHTQIYRDITRFWMGGWVLIGMSQSVECEFLDISWLTALFLWIFAKAYIDLNTHPLTQSQQYPPLNKYHINTPFLKVRYPAKKSRKVTQNPFTTRGCAASAGALACATRSQPEPIRIHFFLCCTNWTWDERAH